MLKTLGAQIKEFKKASLVTPVFMIAEVVMDDYSAVDGVHY